MLGHIPRLVTAATACSAPRFKLNPINPQTFELGSYLVEYGQELLEPTCIRSGRTTRPLSDWVPVAIGLLRVKTDA